MIELTQDLLKEPGQLLCASCYDTAIIASTYTIDGGMDQFNVDINRHYLRNLSQCQHSKYYRQTF